MAKLYTCGAVEGLEKQINEAGGRVYELEPGVLGYGLSVMYAKGYRIAVVKEIPQNEWSSAHSIRFYEKIPEKYGKAIYEKFGDMLPGYIPPGIDGMRKFLSKTLLPPQY